MKQLLSNIGSGILELVYPSRCCVCDTLVRGKLGLCEACDDKIARIEEGFCEVCGEDFEGVFSANPICPNCHDLQFSFQYAKAGLWNTSKNRELVRAFKYRKQRHLAVVLAKFCAEVLEQDERFYHLPDPVLVPIPLHWWRELKRGFNQACLLSNELTKQTDIPTLKLLRRKRYTTTQTLLSRKERMGNLKDAFCVRSNVRSELEKYRSIILVDDVFTTGSTAEECARILREEFLKIENIVVVTALRG